ncbi:hypothetical protein [Pyxidicoccus trucidator]|uniref:hypothetical protein n=1 Tax=Pyxidicoccus trucidator TaxID=2709662 RepID=UPI0013DD2D4D|nr:hypothetical protein [Pyxidicoccus trucidator]
MGRTIIGKLRLRGADLEPLSARLRLESLLSGAHLVPLGLPPSATVCIRRLMDPKPGVLPVRQLALRPPSAWDEAMVSALEAQVARAARPARGAVPPGAEAVLFADPSELLACLASDVSRGSALAHWWWRGLFPSVDLARTVVAEWLRQPEYVPAALEASVRRGEARPVLALFTEAEAGTVLAQVARVHGLTTLAPVGRADGEGPARDAAREVAGGDGHGAVVGGSVAIAPPWEPWVPEVRTLGLGQARQALLGVALMLRRAPEETRRSEFAPAVVAWRGGKHEVLEGVEVRPAPVAPTAAMEVRAERVDSGDGGSGSRGVTEATSEQVASRAEQTAPVGVDSGAVHAPREMAGTLETPVVAVESSPAPGMMGGLPPVSDGRMEAERVMEPVGAVEAPAPPAPPELPSTPPRVFEPPPGRAWGLPISTGLGGLFYLVNLALFLEMYGDFSRPAHPHLPLSLWDFVTLVGRRLLVDPRTGDPVWKVLALLSGRKAGDAPGAGFEPPEAWRIPSEWLLAFRAPEESLWTWEARDERVRVLHPAGFLVLDVPCAGGDDAGAQVLRETEAFSRECAFTLVDGAVPAPAEVEASALERWLAWLVPYCRSRLVRALGLAPDDAPALEAAVLTHDARLHVTETHVDVVLALSQLPLAVRVAGLDRDIGWLPSAGRHLTFHFE